MKSVITQAVITSINSKADRSVGLRVATPELSVEEKTLFFELQNVPVHLTIKPDESFAAPEYTVNKDLEQKTPSQRLRNSLYVVWRQKDEGMEDFEVYYKSKMEKFIQHVQAQIEDNV